MFVVQALRRLGVIHLHCKMKSSAIKYYCSTRKTLDCLFSFTLLNFFNTKVTRACFYKADREEAAIWHLGPHLHLTHHHLVVKSVPAWSASFHVFLKVLPHTHQHSDISAAVDHQSTSSCRHLQTSQFEIKFFTFLSSYACPQRFRQYPICCGNRMKSGKGDPIQGWAPGVSSLCSVRGQWPNK